MLRRYRLAAGLSQEGLAERARVSTEAVSALERGTRRAPQRQTLALLIEALHLEGHERDELSRAAVRPSVPRSRSDLPANLAGLVSPIRVPIPMTSFVGRDAQLADVAAALADGRLVTLLGTGGVGKSRLAFEAARRLSDRFADGSILIELAPVASGASVVPAFATALGITEESDVALIDRLVAAQRACEQLIIVDNCEHVVHETAEVIYALLTRCPLLRVIATSREPLRIPGERIMRIGPLPPEQAVQLFIDRAKAVAPALAFAPAEIATAEAICRRVDGIPLAIELAASRSDMLDLEAILDRLFTHFESLSTGMRTALPYHRTLRALVDWSYDLLAPDEMRVFRRLAAFSGGGRLDDIEAIVPGDDGSLADVLPVLARLHDKSLVDVDRARLPRFSMLQTIGDYARDRLDASGEGAFIRSRHAARYLDLAIGCHADLRSERMGETILRLSAEADNLRTALVFCTVEPAFRERGLRAIGALAFYWLRIGAPTEGIHFVEQLLGDDREETAGVAATCAGAAFLEINRGEYDRALRFAERAARAASTCGDRWTEIYGSIARCTASSLLGSDVRAESVATYERAKQDGDPWLLASATFGVGDASYCRGDLSTAARWFEESLARSEATGDPFMVATSSLFLGRAVLETDPVRAARLIGSAVGHLAPSVFYVENIESLVTAAIAIGTCDAAAQLLRIAHEYRRNAGLTPNRALVDAVEGICGPIVLAGLPSTQQALYASAGDAIRSFLARLDG